MTIEQLKEVMKYYLKAFNDENVEISDETVHNEALSSEDGFTGPTSSKSIYRASVRWTLSRAGHDDKSWPSGWFDKDVNFLAEKII